MPRPNRIHEQRAALIPIVAKAFSQLGFRRATTAELARRCGVQENILYRLWPDKKGMFIAAIAHVHERSIEYWENVLIDSGDGRSAAERLLAFQAEYNSEDSLVRLIFAGLSEVDDPDIREALHRNYSRYQRFIVRRLVEHRPVGSDEAAAELDAWAIIGLGTISEISRELGLAGEDDRRHLWQRAGTLLMNADAV